MEKQQATKHDRRWDDQITWRSGLIITIGSVIACMVIYGVVLGTAWLSQFI